MIFTNNTRKALSDIGLLGVAALATIGCSPMEKKAERPNIIFIMSDDHAEQAISCYGNSINQTPNIDRIAKEGVRFTQACVTNSICAPSRAVILTGKHSHVNGLINNEVMFDGKQQTFPKLLQKAGYETALIGKWHLKSDPTGFDYWSVLPGQGDYYNPDFIEMGKKKQFPGYVTNLITEFSLDWLKKKHQKGKPFCLLMQHKAPHRNWQPDIKNLNRFDSVEIPVPETFFDDYKTRGMAARDHELDIDKIMNMGYDLKMTIAEGSDEIIKDGWGNSFERMSPEQRAAWDKAYRVKNDAFHKAKLTGKELAIWKYKRYIQDYLSTIESVDESIGKLLDYLDESGLAENTIVVYTSDQGFYLGEHGWFDKRFMYEESMSTPLVIRYPKGIRKGWVSDKLVQNLDFAETFLDYAGVSIPEDMQGKSMRPLLEEKEVKWRDALYYQYFEYPGVHSVKRHYGIRTDRYKLIHFYYDVNEWELYDLETDPNELNNLFGQAGYEALTAKLKKQLEGLRKEYKVPDTKDELNLRETTIQHMGVGAKVKLTNKPAKPYIGSKNSLTDGKVKQFNSVWASDFSHFYGFNGDDLEAVLDLGQLKNINELKVRFLNKTGAWVHLPKEVRFSVSVDGENFKALEVPSSQTVERMNNVSVEEYYLNKIAKKARFVKIEGVNVGIIPEGFSGSGSKAWLFVEEFIVN